MNSELCAEKALIFRIVHRDNLRLLLADGIHCRNSSVDPSTYVQIGNPELIQKRVDRAIPIRPGGTLSDYVPFYFTPFSVMMRNIITGWNGIRQRSNEEIVIFVSSLFHLKAQNIPFIYADRHAYLRLAQFSDDLGDLGMIDWISLQHRNFRKDDVDRFEKYQAEALVHRHLPVAGLLGIVSYDDVTLNFVNAEVERAGHTIKTVARRGWYF